MSLTDEQKQLLAGWIQDGASLSDIQRRLDEEFKIKMTYMDVRFLMLDLGMTVQDKAVEKEPEVEAPAVPPPAAEAASAEPPASVPLDAEHIPADSALTLEVDRLMKPGSLVSGTVTFSDGVTASWMLDQMGRLALDASQPNYTPSEADLQAFQSQLRSALERRGF